MKNIRTILFPFLFYSILFAETTLVVNGKTIKTSSDYIIINGDTIIIDGKSISTKSKSVKEQADIVDRKLTDFDHLQLD